MATAEPTRADDAEPGAGQREGVCTGTDTRIPQSAPQETRDARTSTDSLKSNEAKSPTDPDERAPLGTADASRRERLLRFLRHPVTVTTAVAAVAHLVWFFTFANGGGDLAAQDAWTEFVGRHPDSAYNLAWYGGMHPVSYSVVSPYLMSVLGVRTTMMVAGTASAALLTLMLIRSRVVRRPLLPALAGVFGLLCNAMSGRVTFGLGIVFGLGACAAVFCWPYRWRYKRWAKAAVAAPLAGIATAASPVAGLFVGLVAVALFLQKRRPGAYALGIAPSVVVALSSWLFPFSGTQPLPFLSALAPVVICLATCYVVPKEWKTVRIASAVYALATVLSWVITSQIGSNITRLAMVFTGVVLAAALPFTVRRTRKWYTLVVVLIGFFAWVGGHTVNDVVHTAPTASWAHELAPLVHQLQVVGAERGRVEVVPARSHREASALAPYVDLARGWNRQADLELNPLFYDDTLNSANYHEWLQRWAVHYVVLPKDEPDGDGGQRERDLVRRGEPYLKQIWGDANWQLFTVTDPIPLATPPAVVDRAAQGELTIELKRAGRVLIRVPYSPWLGLVDENGKGVEPPRETEASKRRADGELKTFENVNGCLMEAEEDTAGDKWTELIAPRAGVYRLGSPYQLPRGTPCPEELR